MKPTILQSGVWRAGFRNADPTQLDLPGLSFKLYPPNPEVCLLNLLSIIFMTSTPLTRVLILGVWPAKFENMDLTRI